MTTDFVVPAVIKPQIKRFIHPLTSHKMAVIAALQKNPEPKGQELITKKHIKSHFKSRPITATLDHPLILDIKLLKRLDMTTFTKKGLIALSKFCGISLITTTDTKKKFSRTLKAVQHPKKNSGSEGDTLAVDSNKTYRTKQKFGKQVGKTKPRIRFKIPKDETSPDEDSLDVICKTHKKPLKPCNQSSKSDEKNLLESILNGTKENVVPEPCRTCNRSEHPERFHSHPKVLMRLSMEGQTSEKSLEEKFRHVVTTKEEKEEVKRSSCAKDTLQESNSEPTPERNPSKLSSKSPSCSSVTLSSPETGKKSKNSKKPLTPTNSKSKCQILKKSDSKIESIEKDEIKATTDDSRFVTGCYVCGKQVSPKLRIKHEKTCIAEWRTQNSLVSPDKRKPEPKRPDYRFTGTGEVDMEGTFESIWANHMDSLVPCKKCGRKFFPDRIERHENCCNNVPISIKYKH